MNHEIHDFIITNEYIPGREIPEINVVKPNKSVVKILQVTIARRTDQEFIAEMINSLKSLEIGIRVLLIMISFELIASIWSTFTIYDLCAR